MALCCPSFHLKPSLRRTRKSSARKAIQKILFLRRPKTYRSPSLWGSLSQSKLLQELVSICFCICGDHEYYRILFEVLRSTSSGTHALVVHSFKISLLKNLCQTRSPRKFLNEHLRFSALPRKIHLSGQPRVFHTNLTKLDCLVIV